VLFEEWVRCDDGSGDVRCVMEQSPLTWLARKVIDLGCWGGRHWLCSPRSWAFEVGRPWREWPQERLNLGNLWWALGFWLLNHPRAREVSRMHVAADDVPPRVRRAFPPLEETGEADDDADDWAG
jgi:hypothetical protein